MSIVPFRLPDEARRLAGAWFLLALAALGASALLAMVLVAARTPFLSLGSGMFRTALVLHVDMAVLVWFLAAAAGLWVIARGKAEIAGWGAFWLSAGAVPLLLLSPLLVAAPPILSNYIPALDSLLFLGALTAFFTGILLTAAWSVADGWRREHEAWARAARWSVLALGAAALVFVLDFFAAPVPGTIAPPGFDEKTWGAGHLLQFVHVVLLIGVWSVLGERLLAHAPRLAAALPLLLAAAALPALGGVLIPLSSDLGSGAHRAGFTELMRWAAWPAAAVFGLGLLGAAWRMRRSGEPLSGEEKVLLLSVLLFLAGCLVGATIRGNATTSVPAHYHGTVGAITLAYLLLARRLALAFGLSLPTAPWTQRLPLVYGIGIGVLVAGLAWSGLLGVPRKATHVELAQTDGGYLAAMGLAGIGGFFALAAVSLFVALLLAAVWRAHAAAADSDERRGARGLALLAMLAPVTIGGLLLGAAAGWLPSGAQKTLPEVSPEHTHVIEKRREEIALRFQQGVAMLHAKQYDYAIAAFHRVLELAPDMPEAHANLGFALLGKREYAAAADFFDEASNLRSGQLNAYYGMAIAQEGLGNLRAAIEAMQAWLHRAPADDPYRRKAEAATWEWQETLRKQREAMQPGGK
ncbi:MAG: hypothetical protein A2Z95_01250 [Gallionellales bacterium GWA2_60_18]|nr:MAG: hypothetical protein A2Z95_01250 [Gallionellales bacterium GWA2_60_18]